MKIPIESTEDSCDLLVRHFKEHTALHDILEHATRNEFAGFQSMPSSVSCSKQRRCSRWARDHCPPAVKDIEHAIFAATAA
jgi:hypothetical protein